MHKAKGLAAVASITIDSLEQRLLFATYAPTVLYTFPSAPVVNTLFPNANGSVTFADDGGISTEPAAGGTPTTLANFSVGGIDGPRGLSFEDSAGDIFGSADSGGTDTQPSGALWELASGSNNLTLAASFDPTTVGAEPSAEAMDSSGNIYGYTDLGANGTTPGSLWEYHAATHQISYVAIPSGDQGFSGAMVIDSSGDLFGATEGSSTNPGVVFELAAGSSTVTTLAIFSSGQNGTIGNLVMDKSGNIYGICNNGSVDEYYEVSVANRSVITPLASIPSSSGLLTINSVGDLFSVGEQISGTITDSIYELISGNRVSQKVATLSSATEGDDTYALAINNSTGVIYGATEDGGADGNGALFSLNPGGGTTGSTSLAVTIAKSTLPASVVAGGTSRGQAVVDITNSGTTTYSSTDTVNIYASADGVIDGASTLIGTVTRRATIKAGKTLPVPVAIKSLPATLDGTYTLLAQVSDTTGATAESTTGPTLTAAAPFISFSETLIRTTLAPSDVSGQKTKARVQLKVTNSGNIVSSGESTVALYVSPDTTAADGTLVRSVTEPIALRPSASRVVTIPLLSLPAVANGNYYLVAQVTDPKADVTAVASAAPYELAAPFSSLEPLLATSSANGSVIRITVSNTGNIAAPGLSTISVLNSVDGTVANSTVAYSQRSNLATIQPGKSRTLAIHLSKAIVAMLSSANFVLVQVTDPLGNSQSVEVEV